MQPLCEPCKAFCILRRACRVALAELTHQQWLQHMQRCTARPAEVRGQNELENPLSKDAILVCLCVILPGFFPSL